MSHSILLALASRRLSDSYDDRARAVSALLETIDAAAESVFGKFPQDITCSVGPGVAMLAFPDVEPTRVLNLLDSICRQLETNDGPGSLAAPLTAVITAGPMKKLNVLGFSNNFEGEPAIAAARILGAVRDNQVAVAESLWGFPLISQACGPEEKIAGKHEGEFFNIRRFLGYRLGAPAPITAVQAVPVGLTIDRPDNSIGVATLERVVREHEWILGAINFDEDLHFSSFYLRQSSQRHLPPELKRFGYSHLISVYAEFDESYYIPQEECLRVAQELLKQLQTDPAWLQSVLDEIYKRAEALHEVFPFKDTDQPFVKMNTVELLAIYRLHTQRHVALYEFARLPEALDRGVALFTRYLKDYLKGRPRAQSMAAKDLNRLWEQLTFPEKMSTTLAELSEFHKLLLDIRSSARSSDAFSRGAKRAILSLEPAVRERILVHRSKWSFLGYHGYGSRVLPDISDYVDRISATLEKNGGVDVARITDAATFADAELVRVSQFKGFDIDQVHQLLFRLHSRVGIAKLHRRHVQLRNFYFLDQLMVEIAMRFGLAEGTVRCLVPEEVERLLQGEVVTQEQRRRTEYAVSLITPTEERVFAGREFKWVEDELRRRSSARRVQEGKISGESVCGGTVRGTARIIIRRADADKVGFTDGDILVSESTDPDLWALIDRASGVITEAGGITCHASIVCREMKKPALVGVPNLLSIVRNGDRIVLNASEGYFTVLPREPGVFVVQDVQVDNETAERVGPKAIALSKLLKAGVSVPRFFVVPIELVRTRLAGPTSDAGGSAASELLGEIRVALEHLAGELFIIRSSMANEDGSTGSEAGLYMSEAMVERQDVVPALRQFIQGLLAAGWDEPKGGVIVQEMVLGDVSGTCFTCDPVSGDIERLVVEAVAGGNEELTSGEVVPVRYVIQRQTRQIIGSETHGQWRSLLPSDAMRNLLDQSLTIERLLGNHPQDIEWTLKRRKLSFLQARPVTALDEQRVNPPVIVRRPERGFGTVASIYRAHRVPPNLQLHLLRVAAIGAIICDNWKGPSLDRHTILSALLLHDIGNIVKADYDQFPTLMPEELQHLPYWKAVQASVIGKYGDKDQDVAVAIAKELEVGSRVIEVMRGKVFTANEETLACDDWEIKICAYADQRVAPSGVMPLTERLMDAKARYRGVVHASVNDPRFDSLMDCAVRIERQIAERCRLDLATIDESMTTEIRDSLREYALLQPAGAS